MSGFLLGFFTTVLVLASLFMIFVVLLQRGSDGGAGSAFGGGAAESAFGGETSKVLTKATVITAIIFFAVGLGLYLGQISAHKIATKDKLSLEKIVAAADAKAQAKAKADNPTTPKPGEMTQEAMQVLAAETKSGSDAKAHSTATVQKAQMIDATTAATQK